MYYKAIRIIFFIAFIFSPLLVSHSFAAGMGGGGGNNPPCGFPLPPCPIPLDNGVLALLILGGAYGSFKIYQSLKKNPV